MHQLLYRRPVHVFEIGAADANRLVHLRRAQTDIEFQVVIVRLRLPQVRQRRRILHRAMDAARLQRLARDDPRTDRGRKCLGLERPERHVFPLLDIARAPIVEEHKAEDHLFRLLFIEHFTHRRRLPDHNAHFQLKIEPLTGPETRQFRIWRLQLAARPAHPGARDHDGGGAAVVTDWHMQPVRLQRVVLASEHGADIGGVFLRRIEIGVTGDRDRKAHFCVGHRHQRAFPQGLVVAQFGIVVAQQLANPRPGAGPDLRAKCHEGIDRGLCKHPSRRRKIEQSF